MSASAATHAITDVDLTGPNWAAVPVRRRELCPANRLPDRLALAPGYAVVPLRREHRSRFRSHVDPVGRSQAFERPGLGSAWRGFLEDRRGAKPKLGKPHSVR